MHIPAAAQLSPPPLQPSSGTPALPAPPRAFPACCRRSLCDGHPATLWLVREGCQGRGPCHRVVREHPIPCTGWGGCWMPLAEADLGCISPLVGYHTHWLGHPRAGEDLASPQVQPVPSTEPYCRGAAWPCCRRDCRAPPQMAAGPPNPSAVRARAGLGLLLTFAFPGTAALSHGPARAGT